MIWKNKTAGDIEASPSIAGDVIVYQDSRSNVYAANVSDGEVLWNYETIGTAVSTAAISDTCIYIGCNESFLYSLK